MRIKLFVMLLFVFLLSGCTVDYNIVVNDDLSISETISWGITDVDITEDTPIYRESIEEIYDEWYYNLEAYEYNVENFAGYQKTFIENGNEKGMDLERDYINISTYYDNSSVKIFAHYVDLKETHNKLIFDMYLDKEFFNSDILFSSATSVNINIQSKLDAISNNADEVDNENNIYTLHINSSLNDLSVNIVFDKNTHTIFSNKNLKVIFYVIIGIIIILGLYFLIIKRKNNKI